MALKNGGHPEIIWKKKNFTGLDIYVDRGEGKFTFLATHMQPNYIDMAPLPAYGQSAIWIYVAVYRMGDKQTGDYSDIVEVVVKGVV